MPRLRLRLPICIDFLRAVNVGGRTIKMDALRTEFVALGLTGVETFIASGNVVFETRARALAAVERKLEAQLNRAFGFEVHAFVRSAAALTAIAAHAAFSAADVASAATFVVGFVAEPLSAQATARVLQFRNAGDDFHVHGREVCWLSRATQSESKFSNLAFERALQVRATFRSMSTVQRLLAKHVGAGPQP